FFQIINHQSSINKSPITDSVAERNRRVNEEVPVDDDRLSFSQPFIDVDGVFSLEPELHLSPLVSPRPDLHEHERLFALADDAVGRGADRVARAPAAVLGRREGAVDAAVADLAERAERVLLPVEVGGLEGLDRDVLALRVFGRGAAVGGEGDRERELLVEALEL